MSDFSSTSKQRKIQKPLATKINEAELFSSLDANRDGVLDTTEFHALSQQLTNQLQYSNSLLSQIQALEEENFSLQQELHSQREFIKQCSQNSGELKDEVSGLKHKLKMTQGIADTLSKQLRECRIENDMLKKDLDALTSTNLALKSDVENIKKELLITKKSLSEGEKAKNRAVEDSRIQKNEMEYRINSLLSKNESVINECTSLKAKLTELERDGNEIKSNAHELTISYNELKKQFDTEQFARQLAERKVNALAANGETLQRQLQGRDAQQKELQTKFDNLSTKMQQQLNDKTALEEKAHELEATLIDLQSSQKSLADERAALQRQLDKQKAEHSNELARTRLEAEKQYQGLLHKHSEAHQALSEARKQSEDSLASTQQKLIDTYKAKALAEEKVKGVHAQMEELHASIDGLKADHKLQLADAALQFTKSQEANMKLQKQVEELLQANQELGGQLSADKDATQSWLKDARQKFIDRSGESIEAFSAIQEALGALSEDVYEGKNHLKELANEIVFIRKKAESISTVHGSAMEGLRRELMAAFKVMKAKSERKTAEVEKAKDELKAEQLAKEELVGRNLLLEEQVSRLEHDALQTQRRMGVLEREATHNSSRHSIEMDKLMDDKRALEERLAELLQSHDVAQADLWKLKEDHRKAHEALEEKQKAHTSLKHEADLKLGYSFLSPLMLDS